MDASIWITILTVALLILLSGTFSGSETALTSLSRARLHQMKSKGVKRADVVTKLRERKDRLIGALLLGNNAVNILASAIATSLAIEIFGDDGVMVATFVMTTLLLIFAEVLPKTYAINNAESMSLRVAPFINILVKVLSPITSQVQRMVDIILKILGVKKNQNKFSAIEELRGAIELHHQEGSVEKRDRDMLGSILDLAETEISNIMIHRKNMVAVNIDQPISSLVNEILESNHTRIPIWKDQTDNIVGIVHVKNLLIVLREHNGNIDNIDINKLMSEPWFVPETNTLNNQLSQFRKQRNHFALVVDEYGDLVGLVSLEDILEEIVGQIKDEHDNIVQGIKKAKDGSVVISGDTTIRDINRSMDWNLPNDKASTVAGLIIYHAETIPDVNSDFSLHGYHFKVVKKRNNQITSIFVEKEIKAIEE